MMMAGAPTRDDQVASLLRTVPSTARRTADIYDVGIRLSDQKILTLRTELPASFPRVPPILRIMDPGATHPWLDSSGRVAGLADLYNWDERTSDLGQVVQKTLTEFCTRAPHINPALIAAQKVKNNWVQTLPPPAQHVRNEATTQLIQLSVPDSFPELEALDAKQLQELLENESVFDKFLHSLSVVSNAQQLRDSVRTGNTDKATENTTLAKDFTDLHNRVDALTKRLSDARNMYTRLLAEQKASGAIFDPKKLAEEFERLARQSDAASEEVASHMFEDPAAMDTALGRFREFRKQYHLRRAIADRCRAQFSS